MAVKDKKPAKLKPGDDAMAAIRADRGLAVKIAKSIGITRMAVYQWPRVPVDRIHAVAEVTGWRVQDIRPDIFRHQR
jgi:hypothetical protein